MQARARSASRGAGLGGYRIEERRGDGVRRWVATSHTLFWENQPTRSAERAVLDGIRAKLDDPELIKAYNNERPRLADDAIHNRAKIEAGLEDAQRELDQAFQNLIKGGLAMTRPTSSRKTWGFNVRPGRP